MSASLPWVIAITQMQPRQWGGCGDVEKRHSGPENAPAEPNPDAERLREAARLLATRRRSRGLDALGRLIAAYLREIPNIEPIAVWRDLEHRVDERGIVVEFDGTTLSWARKPGGATSDIAYDAFRRKVQRIRARQLR
jgi:hypothetical protein